MNYCDVKYLSVTNVGLQRQTNVLRKGQTIVRLNTCRLLIVGLQRQAVYFFKGLNNYEVQYLSVANVGLQRQVSYWFKRKVKQL